MNYDGTTVEELQKQGTWRLQSLKDAAKENQRSTPRSAPVKCGECGENTSHGKPFCTDHVYMNPYAADLLARIAAGEGTEEQDS